MLLSNVTRGLQEKTRALFGSSGSALSLYHREVTLKGREGLDGFIFSSVLFFFSSGANGTQSNQSLYVDAVMCYRLLDCCLGVERHFPNATIIGALRRKNGNVTG